jgi:hypothetical protein
LKEGGGWRGNQEGNALLGEDEQRQKQETTDHVVPGALVCCDAALALGWRISGVEGEEKSRRLTVEGIPG